MASFSCKIFRMATRKDQSIRYLFLSEFQEQMLNVRYKGILVRGFEGGGYQLTYTGLLVFGKQMSLRRLVPSFRVDYIRIKYEKVDEQRRNESTYYFFVFTPSL